ncbi:hypothetical protein HNQ50_000123 [Silvimonas terrae]|uniref:Uncharacterized protein n=1 Tax=Silvimonas terrae TaxID=300266 RepID=A0A840RAH1_9NEIS|nr:hypothetical protein [Silvimonas terrae]MBB5189413.1 hypothetical protein [Silvimonas terrae]
MSVSLIANYKQLSHVGLVGVIMTLQEGVTLMDEITRINLEHAEKALIATSIAFREAKDRVQLGEATDDEVWPLFDARKLAYAKWRAIADPLVAQGVPLSAEVLKILQEHRR